MAKEQGTYRLPANTKAQIEELKIIFGETPSVVIERAVAYLYANRKEEAERVMKERIQGIK